MSETVESVLPSGLIIVSQESDSESCEPPSKCLLSRREVADMLGISERTLYNLTSSGEIPCVRIGRRVAYNAATVQEFIKCRAGGGARNAPHAGQWAPTDEHETKFGFRFGRGRITITVTHDPFRDDDVMRVRRWLVDSLKAWPHPDAPRTDDEADYPAWRERCYRELCEEKN